MNDITAARHSPRPTEPKPKRRVTLIKFFVIVMPLWLSAMFFDGPYHEQVQYYLAGIVFFICWAILIQIALPWIRETPLLIALFSLFCIVELVAWQYPSMLQGLAVHIDGRMVIGAHHSLNKIPYYGVGAFISYFILRACRPD